MQQQNLNYYCPQDELDEELNIDLKRIFLSIWCRKQLIIKVFISVFIFFILLTFITPKKFKVDADLYINKTNSSNMAEINPYFISEVGTGGGMSAMLAGGGNLTNELELMQSPLVIDKVIRENDLRFKKLFGIFTTVKTGEYLTTEKFLKKKVSFDIKKGTNIVTVSFKSKDKELAYGVVNSIIENYIQLHKELNTEKSKADKALLESEYNKAKANLTNKMNSISGLPQAAVTGAGGIAALTAISKSANKAVSGMQSQYISGVKSEIDLREESEKVAELAKKLEWAKLVENMSDSSNVVILKEPRHLQDYEQESPKLLINIILGIVFGIIASLIAVILKENINKNLTYSMLGENILYNDDDKIINLKSDLLANDDKKITFVLFESIPPDIQTVLKNFKNIDCVKADISNDLTDKTKNSDIVYLVSEINKTESKLYKQVTGILQKINIRTIKDLLI